MIVRSYNDLITLGIIDDILFGRIGEKLPFVGKFFDYSKSSTNSLFT